MKKAKGSVYMKRGLPYIMALLLLGAIIACLALIACRGGASEGRLAGASFVHASAIPVNARPSHA